MHTEAVRTATVRAFIGYVEPLSNLLMYGEPLCTMYMRRRRAWDIMVEDQQTLFAQWHWPT